MWNHKPSDRLHEWKEFRTALAEKTLEQTVVDVSHLWSYAPYVNYYLDPADLSNWPDPWTLLHENYYCDLAKALGMLYTLYLSSHYNNSITDLEIKIFKDPKSLDVYNTVWVNQGKYILNLDFDTVVNKTQVDENLVLNHCVAVSDLQLNLY